MLSRYQQWQTIDHVLLQEAVDSAAQVGWLPADVTVLVVINIFYFLMPTCQE